MSRLGRLLVAILLLPFAGASLWAQGAEEEKPRGGPTGRWVNGYQRWAVERPERGIDGLSSAGARELQAAVERMLDVVGAAPVVNRPAGTVCVGIGGTLPSWASASEPFGGRKLYMPGIDIVLPGRKPGGSTCGEGYVVSVWMNDPGALVRRFPVKALGNDVSTLRDARGIMYFGPNANGTVADGTVRWQHRARWVALLTKRTEPAFLPVSTEAYLTAWLEAQQRGLGEVSARVASYTAPDGAAVEAEIAKTTRELRADVLKQAAEMERSGFPEIAAKLRADLEGNLARMAEARRTVARAQAKVAVDAPEQMARSRTIADDLADRVRAQLASLSPAERRAPACEGTSGAKPTYLVPCDAPGADAIVQVNPDFLDASLPPTAVQHVVVITKKAGLGGESQAMHDWRIRVFHELDYTGLHALLK